MKKKIGELYDKPIVIGNKNEVEKHEIHIEDVNVPQEGGGGGSGMFYLPKFYKADFSSISAEQGVYLDNFVAQKKITVLANSIDAQQIFSQGAGAYVDAIAYLPVIQGEERWDTFAVMLSKVGIELTCEEITAEEFYNLETA